MLQSLMQFMGWNDGVVGSTIKKDSYYALSNALENKGRSNIQIMRNFKIKNNCYKDEGNPCDVLESDLKYGYKGEEIPGAPDE